MLRRNQSCTDGIDVTVVVEVTWAAVQLLMIINKGAEDGAHPSLPAPPLLAEVVDDVGFEGLDDLAFVFSGTAMST